MTGSQKLEVYASRFWWSNATLYCGVLSVVSYLGCLSGEGWTAVPVLAVPVACFTFLMSMGLTAMLGDALAPLVKISVGVIPGVFALIYILAYLGVLK